MITNYLKIALRNLWKQRFFTLINVSGLMLAVTVGLIIYLYVTEELGHDNGLIKKERVYRLLRDATLNGEDYLIGITSAPFADGLKNDFPLEIDETLRVYSNQLSVAYEDKTFLEDDFIMADSNFFDFFHRDFIVGDPVQALSLPNAVVITEEIALKYFGDDEPMGKTIRVNDQFDYIVTGVIKQIRVKTHLPFDMVANNAVLKNENWFSQWWSNSMITYLTLNPAASRTALEKRFPAFMDKYFGEDFIRFQTRIDLVLQPVEEIYFQGTLKYDVVNTGSVVTVRILAAIGVFVLLIACINFINLSTAKSISRAREVGIRKTLGSSRKRIVLQFLAESYLVTMIAIVLGFMAVELSLPLLNDIFETDLNFSWLDGSIWRLAGATIILLGFATGVYPAFVMSGFSPVKALKGKGGKARGNGTLRKVLVVIQFAISIFMITATLVMSGQLGFLKNKNLGFNKEDVLLLELNNTEVMNKANTLKNRLLESSLITEVSCATGEPGGFHDTMTYEIEGLEDNLRLRTVFCDTDYIKSLHLEVIAGRDFSENYSTDQSNALILNERAVRDIGWTPEEAIGKQILNSFLDSIPRQVVGVVKDYHFSSLKNSIEPLAITAVTSANTALMVIRTSGGEITAVVEELREKWDGFTSFPMEYRFLDSSLDRLYQEEQLQAKLFTVFSSISVFVACLGILGMASFMVTQRTKEMGIRKVLGASAASITLLLTGGFLTPVVLANLLAVPTGWYFSHQWLNTFAYHIDISVTIFLLAALIALGIAFLSVTFQSLKAIRTNPVDILKDE